MSPKMGKPVIDDGFEAAGSESTKQSAAADSADANLGVVRLKLTCFANDCIYSGLGFSQRPR